MIKKIVLSFIFVLILAGAGGYFWYLYPVSVSVSVPAPEAPAATPDLSVIAGPVTAVSFSAITVKKQDGSTAKLGIVSDTKLLLAGGSGLVGTPQTASDIKVGMTVVVTPSAANTSVAEAVVILPPPPVN